MSKKRLVTFQQKHNNQVNLKALIWIGSVIIFIVLAMAVLLIFNK